MRRGLYKGDIQTTKIILKCHKDGFKLSFIVCIVSFCSIDSLLQTVSDSNEILKDNAQKEGNKETSGS